MLNMDERRDALARGRIICRKIFKSELSRIDPSLTRVQCRHTLIGKIYSFNFNLRRENCAVAFSSTLEARRVDR